MVRGRVQQFQSDGHALSRRWILKNGHYFVASVVDFELKIDSAKTRRKCATFQIWCHTQVFMYLKKCQLKCCLPSSPTDLNDMCPMLFLFQQSPHCMCVRVLIWVFFSLFGCVSTCAPPVCELMFSTPIGWRQRGADWAQVGQPETLK